MAPGVVSLPNDAAVFPPRSAAPHVKVFRGHFDGLFVVRNLLDPVTLSQLEAEADRMLEQPNAAKAKNNDHPGEGGANHAQYSTTVAPANDLDAQPTIINQHMLLGEKLPNSLTTKLVAPLHACLADFSEHQTDAETLDRLLFEFWEQSGNSGSFCDQNQQKCTSASSVLSCEDGGTRSIASAPSLDRSTLEDMLQQGKTCSENCTRSAAVGGATTDIFDSLIVNRYIPGEGIKPHCDLLRYAECVIGLSLKSCGRLRLRALKMDIRERAGAEQALRESDFLGGSGTEASVADVDLHPGDVYVLAGKARYEASHEILPVVRERVSITLRRLRRE